MSNYSKGPKDKVQLNASISASFAEAIREYSILEGRKIGDTVERMVSVYKGSPKHLLERLKRIKKQDITAQDRVFLLEMQELISFLLFIN